MKKYFLLSSGVLLFVLAANANDLSTPLPKTILKGNFSGKITDAKTGKPIAATTIYITDVKIGSASDNEGNFIIKNIPDGNHLVEISHVGYTTIAENVSISGDTKKDFILTESVVENNAVIVTGVTGATQLKKVPFAVTVLRQAGFFSKYFYQYY